MATATETKKVGGGSQQHPQSKKGDPAKEKVKKEKVGKKPFDLRTLKTDSNGKLLELPKSWNNKEFKPLARKDFAEDALFIEFRALLLDINVVRMTKLRDDLRNRADKLRKFGDDKTRKKAAKLHRMREQMQALEKELAADGISADDLK